MPDTVTTAVVVNDARNIVIKWTNLSDATGEVAVKKFDTTNPIFAPSPGTHLKIWSIAYDVKNGNLRVLWEATANQDCFVLGGFANVVDYGHFGGIIVPPGLAGATGSILFTTVGFALNSSYTVTIHFKKGV